MHLHEVIARTLQSEGLQRLYGVIGDGNMFVADSFDRLPGCRYIAAAHEAGATLLACGEAQATRKLAAATVTHGPGLTNALTALAEARRSRLPIVLLVGRTLPDYSVQHLSHKELIEGVGAAYRDVTEPKAVASSLVDAAAYAREMEVPVAVDLPPRSQWVEIPHPQFSAPTPESVLTPPLADAARIESSRSTLAEAKRPIILVGRGAAGRNEAGLVQDLADSLGAPIVTTVRAMHLLSEHKFNLGVAGAAASPEATRAVRESDLILALGTSLNLWTTRRGEDLLGKRVLHVDTRTDSIEAVIKTLSPTTQYEPIHGTIDSVLTGLLACQEVMQREPWFRKDEISAEVPTLNQNSSSSRTGLSRTDVLAWANLLMGSSRLAVFDAGSYLKEAFRHIKVDHPWDYVHTSSFGVIGQGLPQAIGASVSTGRPTLLLIGDGGFALGGVAELVTLARYRPDIVVVILNDSSYNAEYIQFEDKGKDPSLTTFDWPDFARISRGFNIEAVTICDQEGLQQAKSLVATRTGPVVCNVMVSR